MRRISMAGADVAVTDARIADLVLEYAMLLGRVGGTDVVTLPVADGGVAEHASLLLGPASQIAVTPNDDLHLEQVLLDGVDEVVGVLRERIDRVAAHSGGTEGERGGQRFDDPAAAFVDFDEYRPGVDDD